MEERNLKFRAEPRTTSERNEIRTARDNESAEITELIRVTFITSIRYNTYHRLRVRRLLQRIVSQHEIYRKSADEHSHLQRRKIDPRTFVNRITFVGRYYRWSLTRVLVLSPRLFSRAT